MLSQRDHYLQSSVHVEACSTSAAPNAPKYLAIGITNAMGGGWSLVIVVEFMPISGR